LTGLKYNESIRLSSNNFTTKIRSNILAITNAVSSFKSTYEGFIGLAPPYSDDDELKSFLSFAWYNGLIDNRIFSFYISLDPKIKSSIKFGGYDDSGL
jgi:hypothetical protein